MASIGGTTVDILRGTVPPVMDEVEVWAIPGVDGHGARKQGRRGRPFQLEAIRFGNETTINSFLTALEGHAGSIVTVIDDHGTSTQDVLILAAARPPDAKVRAETGTSTYRGRIVVQGLRLP